MLSIFSNVKLLAIGAIGVVVFGYKGYLKYLLSYANNESKDNDGYVSTVLSDAFSRLWNL